MDEYDKCLEILHKDYGQCYTIGNFMLCPEKKLIRVGKMFGTALKDAFGYFPEPSLKYDEETIVIFAGQIFLLSSNPKIDWSTVRMLSYDDHYSEFTDGKDLFYIKHGDVGKLGKFDEKAYKPNGEEMPKDVLYPDEWGSTDEEEYVEELAKDHNERKPFGRDRYVSFYVSKGKFRYDGHPILEKFDVPNLRTIVSKSGFVTEFITDGKQLLFGGFTGGYTSAKKFGIEHVVVKERLFEDADISSLRVLGRDILADKNALYYRKNKIPFDKLNGFKFILREM